jgi:hypothetical protein
MLDWSFCVERRQEKKPLPVLLPPSPKTGNSSHVHVAKNFHIGDDGDREDSLEEEILKENTTGTINLDLDTRIHNIYDYMRSKSEEDDSYDSADEDLGSRSKISLFDAFYLAFASFTAAENFSPVSKPSKIFVGSWSMLILIIVATYTANLAATLTRTNVFVEEILSMHDAVKLSAKTCVSTRNVYYPSLPTNYSKINELSQLYPYHKVNGLWEDMYEHLNVGTCRVALFNREDITAALQNQKYCDLIVVSVIKN